ncbi:Uma2 family endonuclease [Kitasatospora griseola]|uniref:Uma2 family endonuclease n=1 Tax=Kitasatospora griseola TaxID=2064 RepID=UPI0036DB0EC7
MCAIEPEDPHLLEDFLALEAPEGYRIELVGGEIVLSPPHDGGHAIAISRVVEQVFRAGCEFDLGCHKGLVVPGGHFIPDAVFTEYGAMDGQPPWWKPSGVVMVLEVASRLPARERKIKRSSYAAAGIARYLVLDLREREVVLHERPGRGDYGMTTTVRSGDLLLPEPFGFALDTAELFA